MEHIAMGGHRGQEFSKIQEGLDTILKISISGVLTAGANNHFGRDIKLPALGLISIPNY